MKKYYNVRMEMYDYIKKLYEEAHVNGSPLIRTMFYEFPEDATCWKLTSTGEVFEGGCTGKVDAPIEYMPVFEKQ